MENIRIQDDLYTYVNQEKLEELVIPDDMPMAGGFAALATDVEKLMIGEFNAMCAEAAYPNDYLARACKLYTMAKDVKRKKKHGIKPALKNLAILKKVNTLRGYNLHAKELILKGIAMPINIAVEPNMKDTTHHCVMIQGPGVILPDTSYYAEGKEQQKEMLLNMWSGFAKQVLAIAGYSEEEADALLKNTLSFDALIAKYVKSNEEWSEYTKMYNPMKVGRVAGMVKPLNLKKLLSDLFGAVPEEIIVAEPRYFKNFKEVFNPENFEMYKDWAYVTGLMSSCSLLSEELRDLGGGFRRALSGIAAVSTPEKFAYQLASGMYSEPVGLYYGEKYFGEAAKADIIDIVRQIIATYQKRIKDNDILEQATKEKAILKLSTMGIKMGYPDRVEGIYDKLVFDESKSLFDAVSTLRKIRILENFAKLETTLGDALFTVEIDFAKSWTSKKWQDTPHFHVDNEIHILLDGNAVLEIDGNDISIDTGDICLLAPRTSHYPKLSSDTLEKANFGFSLSQSYGDNRLKKSFSEYVYYSNIFTGEWFCDQLLHDG